MSTRGRASEPVLQGLDHGLEQHIRYKQKMASRRPFEDRFQSLVKQTFDAAFDCHLSKDGDGIDEALTEALLPLTGFSFADRSALTEAEISPADRDTPARGAVPAPLLCQHAIY